MHTSRWKRLLIATGLAALLVPCLGLAGVPCLDEANATADQQATNHGCQSAIAVRQQYPLVSSPAGKDSQRYGFGGVECVDGGSGCGISY